MVNSSLLRPVSIGIVAMDKKLNSNIIEVAPVEDLSMLSGELTDHATDVEVTGVNAIGKRYDVKAIATATVTAEWIPLHQSNRMTSPDVRRGEKVQLYQLANSSRYFWDTIENASNTRRLETVVHAYSATKEENVQLNDTNAYTQGVSTHEKRVNLIHTTKADGEKFAYDIFVDTKAGRIEIKDDIGNEITLDSEAHHWRVQNATGSYFELIKDVCNLFTVKEVNVTTETVNVNSTTYNGTHTNINTKGEIMQIGNQTHMGNIFIGGGLTCGAGLGGSGGGGIFSGSMVCTEFIESHEDVKSNGVSLVRHTHPTPQGMSGPPIPG